MRVEHERVLTLESSLNRVKHLGVPMGSTLAMMFNLHLVSDKRTWGWKDLLRDALSLGNILVGPGPRGGSSRKQDSIRDDLDEGRMLVPLHSLTHRSIDMILPVLDRFSPDEYVLIRPDGAISDAVASLQPAFTWSEVARLYRSLKGRILQWQTVFRVFWELRRTLPELGISRKVMLDILAHVAGHSRRVEAMVGLLRGLRPSVVLTEFDRNDIGAPLVLTAKMLGIPTISLIHGMTEPPYAYVPVLADWLFCWGPTQKKQFRDLGFPPDRIVVTGNPRFRSEPVMEKSKAKVQMGFDHSRSLAILATGPLSEADRRRMVQVFCTAVQAKRGFAGAVRPHPVEKLEFYGPEILQYPEVRFIEPSEQPLDVVLAGADILVTYNSAIVVDALLQRVPVVFLDVTSNPPGMMDKLVLDGNCCVARNTEDLERALTALTADSSFRARIISSLREFSREFCPHTGTESAQKIVEAAKRLINP